MALILSAIVRLRNSSAEHLPFNPPVEQLAPPAKRRHRLLPLGVLQNLLRWAYSGSAC